MAQLTGPQLAQGSPGDSTTRSATALVSIGEIAYSPSKTYKYGLATVAIPSGSPAGIITGYSSMTPGDSDLNKFGGIADAAFALTAPYGWVQIRGFSNALTLSGAIAGDYLELSANNAGYLQKYTTGRIVAIALAASPNANGATNIEPI